MNHSNRISARAMLAVASLAFSPAAWSLGLGDVTVESYLNQPLRARIDLIRNEKDDLSSVTARLASAEDYEMIGASLEGVSVPIRFSVEDVDGDAYLLASSALPLKDPIVRLIVEVDWANGRMLREYTLFLDPPTVSDSAAPTAALPRVDLRETVPAAPSSAPEPEPQTAPAGAEVGPAPADQRAARAQPSAAAGEYGPVANGETLWRIASDWAAGTGLDPNRVMIAIQRANPDAFLNDNINLLKRGAILRLPAVDDVERISRNEAYDEVAQQESAFHARSVSQPVSGARTPLLADEAAAAVSRSEPEEPALPAEDLYATAEAGAETALTEATAAPAEPAADEAPAPEPEPMDTLKLVPPSEDSELDSTYGFEESEEGGDAAIGAEALRENLARTEEELIAEQQQNAYLEDRIRELEAQLSEAQQGNVADSDMANMEQRLREQRQAAAAETGPEPWYRRYAAWLLGLLVVVAGAVGWRMGRSRVSPVAEDTTLRELADEAADVLRVLDETSERPGAVDGSGEPEREAADQDQEAGADSRPAGTGRREPRAFGGAQEEADVLDEESSDPEIQLDLARAYISMGDKEAARVILEEVASNGSEEQQAEARKMLDLM